MKFYQKNINGKVVKRPAVLIVVERDGMKTTNPSHEEIVQDGWEPVQATQTLTIVERFITQEKANRVNEAIFYSKSRNVRSFSLNGNELWLDSATRRTLMFRFESELDNMRTETTIWFDEVSYKLKLDFARKMIQQLEVYAAECYDNTQSIINQIESAKTLEELESIDITQGYPQHPGFFTEQ